MLKKWFACCCSKKTLLNKILIDLPFNENTTTSFINCVSDQQIKRADELVLNVFAQLSNETTANYPCRQICGVVSSAFMLLCHLFEILSTSSAKYSVDVNIHNDIPSSYNVSLSVKNTIIPASSISVVYLYSISSTTPSPFSLFPGHSFCIWKRYDKYYILQSYINQYDFVQNFKEISPQDAVDICDWFAQISGIALSETKTISWTTQDADLWQKITGVFDGYNWVSQELSLTKQCFISFLISTPNTHSSPHVYML